MRRRIAVFVALVLALPSVGVRAQQVRDTAADRVHRLVLAEDYEAAIAAGQELARKGAASPEARAWTVAAMSSYYLVGGSGMQGAARQGVQSMRRRYAGNRWADFAEAVRLLHDGDAGAVAAASRGRRTASWDPDFVALLAEAYSYRPAGGTAAALALLDSAATRTAPHPALSLARATVESQRADRDSAALRRADVACDEALRLDSGYVTAWRRKREIAIRLGWSQQALEAARRAVEAAPTSVPAHELIWAATRQRKDLTPEEARKQIQDDVAALSKARGRTPGLLYTLASLYGDLGLAEQKTSVVAELRRDYPRSLELEQLDSEIIRRLRDSLWRPRPDSMAVRAELRRRLEAFVGAPGHSAASLDRSYGYLLDLLVQDSATPRTELARAAEGALRYHRPMATSVLHSVALRLAEDAGTRPTAERLARGMPTSVRMPSGTIFRSTPGAGAHLVSAPEELRQMQEDMARRARSDMHDALGWVRFKAGQLKAARVQLDSARLLAPQNPLILYHVGQVAERQGRIAEAETWYLKGFTLESPDNPQENGTALRRLFQARDSAPGGFQRLVAERVTKGRQEVYDSVLAWRLKAPRLMPSFTLPKLEGGTFSSDELKGKLVVINFWGTWCAPCLDDLAYIQRLHERYRNDPDVALVTISVEEDAANPARLVANLVKARKLTFPVLLADVNIRQLVTEFPTTWYVDRQGRIVFQDHLPYYGPLVDEFEPMVWRIESLRGNGGKAGPAAPPDTAPAAAKAAPGATAVLPPVHYLPVPAADTLARRLFFQRDFHSGLVAESGRPGDDPSAAAWRILSLLQTGAYTDVLAAVDSMARAWPKSPWTHFVRAAALVEDPMAGVEALKEARLARASAPWDPDMLWVQTLVLNRQPDSGQDIALVDSAQARGVVTAELLVRKAMGQQVLSWGLHPDTTALKKAFATVQEALRLDSLNENAWAFAGDILSAQSQDSAALPFYQRALEASPLSIPAHKDYWWSVLAQRYLSTEDKRREVERDLAWLRAHRPDGPAELDAVADAYRALKDWARSRPVEEELLRRFPDSDAAEKTQVIWNDGVKAPFRGQPLPDSVRTKVLAGLRDFTARPRHHSMFRLGSAYLNWYLLIMNDSTVGPAELTRVVRGMWRYEHLNGHILVGAPVLLADRGVALELADSLARLIPARRRIQIEESKRYSDAAGYALAVRRLDADMYDALGWVHFKQGRVGTARKELQKAIAITPRHEQALWHLGQLEEQTGNLTAAEQAYVRGYAAERGGRTRKNDEALKRLYTHEHGSSDGYDAFVAGIQEKERAERQAKVLAARVKQPAPMPAFKLARLDGGTVDSDSARGRVVVVNFWGTWCGPCIAELPQIQKVAERYAHDPAVLFLTISNDKDLQVLRDFVAKRQLQLPVLLDAGFAARVHINSWPTTWFVGPDGRIAFEQHGGTDAESLSEEYGWRIEDLKRERENN